MVYMVAGYLIIWLASFALIISMVLRQAGLEKELQALKEARNDEMRAGGR